MAAVVLGAGPSGAAVPTEPEGLDLPDATAGEVAGYIVPLDDGIRPLVPSIEEVGTGVRRTEGIEELLVTLDADVFFAFDSAEVLPDALETLERVAGELTGTVSVVGHTDSIGSDAFNDDLSLRRARAVVAVLAERVGPDVTLVPEGRGEREPVAPNTTDDGEDYPEGRAVNRRVELRYADAG